MDAPVPKDGKIFQHILEPAGAFMWVGLVLFGFGIFSGPFTLSNVPLRFGTSLIMLSLAWSRLAKSRWHMTVMGQSSASKSGWNKSKLLWGIVFAAGSGIFLAWPLLPEPWKMIVSRLA